MDISLQLYSVRNRLTEDRHATLEAIRRIGFRNVELFDFIDRQDEYARLLPDVGLVRTDGTCVPVDSEHVAHEPDRVFVASQRLGVKTVIDPLLAGAMEGSCRDRDDRGPAERAQPKRRRTV